MWTVENSISIYMKIGMAAVVTTNSYKKDQKWIHFQKPVCWSKKRPLQKRIQVLRKLKHTKTFVAELQGIQDDDPESDGHDAVGDLFGNVIDVTDPQSDENNRDKQEQDHFHESLNITYNMLSNCTVTHTLALRVPVPEPNLTQQAQRSRGILIDTGAACGNTGSFDQYIAYC